MHLLVKWSPSRPATLTEHKDVADEVGSTWWGCETTAENRRMARERVDRIARQRRRSVPTHAYLYRLGDGPDLAEVWRAEVVGVTDTESEVDLDRRPVGFHGTGCFVFLELAAFEPVAPGWILEHLEMFDAPHGRRVDRGGLGNQTSPLYVVEV